jgi:hypothetical protein
MYWDWGIEPIERIGAIAVDVFKRAIWLAAPTDAQLRERLRTCRRQLHEALADLRAIRHDDKEFWQAWAGRPPVQPQGSTASERVEQLAAWLRDTLPRWPLPPGTKAAPASTLPVRLGDVAARIARVVTDAHDDLRHVTAAAGRGHEAVRVPDAAHETELLDKLLQALLPDGRQISPGSVLRRLLAAEVGQITIAGTPPAIEQEVDFQQISCLTPNAFGAAATPDKITGVKLLWFGAFLKESWRVNDWIWGRLDGATRMVQAVLDPARLRQLGLTAEETCSELRRIAVGGQYRKELGSRFDADREQILAELAFLDAPAGTATPGTMMTVVLSVARRLQAEILTEELPRLAAAVEAERHRHSGRGSRGQCFLDAWDAWQESPEPTLAQLFEMFAQARIADEPLVEAFSPWLSARSAVVAFRLLLTLIPMSFTQLDALLRVLAPARAVWPPTRWPGVGEVSSSARRTGTRAWHTLTGPLTR